MKWVNIHSKQALTFVIISMSHASIMAYVTITVIIVMVITPTGFNAIMNLLA